jgi:hypothetical protein
MACALVKIFGDRSKQRVAIKEADWATGSSQPAT